MRPMQDPTSTKPDPEYRTTTTNPTISETTSKWRPIRVGKRVAIDAPQCPFLLECRVNGVTFYSEMCKEPLSHVSLSEVGSRDGKGFLVRRFRTTPRGKGSSEPALPQKQYSTKPPQPTKQNSSPGSYGPGPASRA